MSFIPCVLSDIDDTLADPSHRRHLVPTGNNRNKPMAWQKFHEQMHLDKPNTEVVNYVMLLAQTCPAAICIMTARPIEYDRKTAHWLVDNGVRGIARLLMRRRGDIRPSEEIKYDLLRELRREGYWPIIALDDDVDVLKMFREQGIPTRQAVNGKLLSKQI
jgi:hypothetical protein